MPYEWIRSLNQYRNIDTQQLLSPDDILEYVQKIIDGETIFGDDLVSQLIGGQISAVEFGDLFKQEVKLAWTQQGILGKGGRSQMDFNDWGWIGRQLRDEYSFIDGFVAVIDNLSEAQIRARAANYFRATRAAYERSYVRAWGIPSLPAYPADGSSICKNGDGCRWIIVQLEGDGNFDCYWTLGSTEHCETCIDRAIEWSPIEVRGGVLGNYRDIKAAHEHH